MTWSSSIPIFAWAGAVVLALVVLGFGAYELTWKANRLRADLARLEALQTQLDRLRDDAVAASVRLAEIAARGAH